MSEIPEIVAPYLPEISAHFASSGDMDQNNTDQLSEINLTVKSAMVPPHSSTEERPPEKDDYHSTYLTTSLESLTRLVKTHSYSLSRPACLPSLLLLCSQHSHIQDVEVPPWSSAEHQLQASLLLSKLESIFKPIKTLLADQDRRLVSQLLSLLQPSLEEFLSQPAAVYSLTWLTSQLLHPHLGQVVPQLLPHALNWIDCWIPYYKVFGCHVVGHIISTCPPSELVWFGRADLLADALGKLLHHADITVTDACKEPLINVYKIKHADTKPDKPGPADLLMKDLINCLELTSDNDKKAVYSKMIQKTVDMLGVGVARWVTRLASLTVSQLDFSPPDSILSLLTQLCSLCPECVGREVPTLLPALVKFIYRTSYSDKESGRTVCDNIGVCLTQVSSCDPATARLLCHNLERVSVNKYFDSVIHRFLKDLALL